MYINVNMYVNGGVDKYGNDYRYACMYVCIFAVLSIFHDMQPKWSQLAHSPKCGIGKHQPKVYLELCNII